MEELLEYDIENILLNRVNDDFPHCLKVSAACDALWTVVSNSVNQDHAQRGDYTKTMEENAVIIATTSSKIKEVHIASADLLLQQKVLDKQITNTFKQQEKVREEITEARSQEESYALEIVDLEQEHQDTKMKKKIQWDGIKQATKVYKSMLQFRMQITDSSEDCDKIRIIFFQQHKNENPRYYVDLIRTTDLWRVELIHPSLNSKQEEQFKDIVNFRRQQEIRDITAFLCFLRKIFKKQYGG